MNDENPWLNELGSFELAQNGGVKVKAPPQQEIYSSKNHHPDRTDFKHELSRTLTSYVSLSISTGALSKSIILECLSGFGKCVSD